MRAAWDRVALLCVGLAAGLIVAWTSSWTQQSGVIFFTFPPPCTQPSPSTTVRCSASAMAVPPAVTSTDTRPLTASVRSPNSSPKLFAAAPFDPVLSRLPCLNVSGGLLSDDQLDVVNWEVLAEVDRQLRPKRCPWKGGEVSIYPIIFGLPAENLVSCPTVKLRDFAQVVAGREETYTFKASDEAEYIHSYRIARFAYTRKKAGWDCARHWEIIAAGSVPFFDDIDNCPQHTLAHLPRSLTSMARRFPSTSFDRITGQLTVDHSSLDEGRYRLLQQQFLHLARNRPTTEALVHYMLAQVNRTADSVQSAVLLSCWDDRRRETDYMDALLTHGWVKVLGERVLVPAPSLSLYQWTDPSVTVPYTEDAMKRFIDGVPYGKGFFYGRRLYDQREKMDESRLHYGSTAGQEELQTALRERRFDLVVYTCLHLARPFMDVVVQHYAQHEILAVDGRDDAEDPEGRRRNTAQQMTLFVREIPDDCDHL